MVVSSKTPSTSSKSFWAAGLPLIPIFDPRYPPRLPEIFDPPVVLFVRGRGKLLQSHLLGVVGRRRPTHTGSRSWNDSCRTWPRRAINRERNGTGIDTAAHKSTLEAGGDTIAVFGCGVDEPYPTENKKLSPEIAENGLLVSEFPTATSAYPQNFPIRSRIITGMSIGVLIVEGAQYSRLSRGQMAIDQQREVFAVPGCIMANMSWGPNLLIKHGAKLAQEWNDVLVELPAEIRRELIHKAQVRQGLLQLDENAEESGSSEQEISPAVRQLLPAIKPDTPVHLDQLLESFDTLSSSYVTSALFELEMIGLVRQLPGRNFVKVW